MRCSRWFPRAAWEPIRDALQSALPRSEMVKVFSGYGQKEKPTTEGTEDTEASIHCTSFVFSVSSVPSVVKSRDFQVLSKLQ
jgi:hypothetical protein